GRARAARHGQPRHRGRGALRARRPLALAHHGPAARHRAALRLPRLRSPRPRHRRRRARHRPPRARRAGRAGGRQDAGRQPPPPGGAAGHPGRGRPGGGDPRRRARLPRGDRGRRLGTRAGSGCDRGSGARAPAARGHPRDPRLGARRRSHVRRGWWHGGLRGEPASALLRARPAARTPEEEASFARMRAASRHLAEHLGEAPALVLVLMPNISMTLEDAEGPLDVGTPFASVYPAVQNLMLAARGLGIGTTLTTVYRVYQDEVRTICGIPERYEVVALVPMGRPVRPFRVGRRRPAERVTHWDRFGAKRG